MCKVSVIMTSYNKADYVGKSIESVLNQTFKDFELILMDDNSNEETLEVIKQYLGDERIRFFKSDVKTIEERTRVNRYATQINKALKMAKGEYISYITDDNIYSKNRLDRMVKFLNPRPKAKICYSASRALYYDENGEFLREVIRKADKLQWNAPCIIDHCSIMHRAEILPIIEKKFGSYWDVDPQFYLLGDARFFWRINSIWPFYPINEILDVNYITEKSLHTQFFAKETNSFIQLLPEQKSCKMLRDDLKKQREARLCRKGRYT